MQPRSLVIVEDDELLSRALTMQVEIMGYCVVAQVKGEAEAVDEVFAKRPDAVVMDVHLAAGGSGLEAARLIRQRLDVPIVFYTAYGDPAFCAEAQMLGNVLVLQKPVPEDRLSDALASATSFS